jgi:YVTN family beta-propeller protein
MAIVALVPAGCEELPTGPDQGSTGRLYVLNQTDATVYVYDLDTNDAYTRIDSFPAGVTEPHYIEFSPDGQFYYIVERNPNGRIAKFNASTNAPLGTVFENQLFPTAIAVTDDGQFGYVGNFTEDGLYTKIYRFSLTTMTLDTSFSTSIMAHDVKITSDGNLVLATNMSDRVTIIDLVGDSVTIIPVDSNNVVPFEEMGIYRPYSLVIDHNDSLAYIACLQHDSVTPQVRVFDIAAREVIDEIHLPHGHPSTLTPHGPTLMSLSPDDAILYVTTQANNTVVAIRLQTKTIEREIPLSIGRPFGVTMSADGSRIYVACVNEQGEQGAVYVIDGQTQDVIDSIMVGKNPYGLLWRPAP